MSDFVTTLLGSAIGAGIIVTLMEYWLGMRRERWQKKRDSLEHQLLLYGPAYCLIFQIHDAIKRAREIERVAEKVQEEKTYAVEPGSWTPEQMNAWWQDFMKVEGVWQSYLKDIVNVSRKCLYERLRDNLHFLDPDDVELARQFFQDYNFAQVEKPEALPQGVAPRLEPYYLIRPDFEKQIEEKFKAKRQELLEMVQRPWWKGCCRKSQ